MCTGPLHSAPSFSGGTVQTGSTVDLLDLQLQRSGGGGVSSAAAAALDGAGMQHGGVSSSEHVSRILLPVPHAPMRTC